jgi:hypothetical protein
MHDTLQAEFRKAAPAVDFCALRYVEESSEFLQVRQDVAEPPQLATQRGAMVTVIDKGGLGLCRPSDLTARGHARGPRPGRAATPTSPRDAASSTIRGRRHAAVPNGTYRSPGGPRPGHAFRAATSTTARRRTL